MKNILVLMIAILSSYSIYAEKVLMLVNANEGLIKNDKQIYQALIDAGLEVDTVRITDAASQTLTDYDLVFISETPGSSDVDNNFIAYSEIPTVSLKTYALKKTNIVWLESLTSFMAASASADLNYNVDAATVIENTKIEILTEHPIFTGIGTVGDQFSFASDNVESYNSGHFQAIDLPNSMVSDIADNSTNLASSVKAENLAWSFTTVLAAIEENPTCKRSIVFGIHSEWKLSTQGIKLIQNAAFWAMNGTQYNQGNDGIVYDTITVYDTIYVNDTVYNYIIKNVTVTDTLVIDVPVSIANNNEVINRIKVFPNPAKDIITINTGQYYSKLQKHNIRIIETTGKIVFTSDLIIPEFQINLGDFGGKGLYFIQVTNELGEIVANRKIVLQ